ncbi:unnamed protein product [Pleuronectes platessa]|uniref:Uncharacterized protein n=1 Tax=Pleuronectes platessa TaxID=8262 RepID=A0A9N7W5L0_PLEPL|nr:unnamed protein product [Pleuronectes platessa]
MPKPSVQGARRIAAHKNNVIPLRSKKNPLLFGPADAAATEEPAPPSFSSHDYSLDFRNIRATRACNTVNRSLHGFVPVTPEAEAPRCAKAASRCFSLRCDRHKVLTWEWMGASCYLRLGAALKRPV